MNYPRSCPRWSWLALAATVGVSGPVLGQGRPPVEEPYPFKLRLDDVNAGLYSEGLFEQTTYRTAGNTITHNRYFVGPALGFTGQGSVYHPYLFRYVLTPEFAYGRAYDTIESGGTVQTRKDWQWLGRFNGNADILSSKPYSGNLYGTYDHSYRDYDFFSRVIVDGWRYGGRAAYNSEDLYVGTSYSHRDEESTGAQYFSVLDEDIVAADVRHTRRRGATSLNYTYTRYSRFDFGSPDHGTDQSASIADSERFGSRDQFQLNSNLGYTHREASFETLDQVTANSILEIQHLANLSSYYDLTYDHFESGVFQSDGYSGRAELRHQLYSSLSSRLIGLASDFEGSDGRNDTYSRRYGGGVAESYTKRLSDNHRLRMDNTILVEQVNQLINYVNNERHSFADTGGAPFPLNQPNVVEPTIVVSDPTGTRIYSRVLDYTVFTNGAITFIERVVGSTIPANGTVLVDYRTETTTTPASYQNLSEYFQIRFDLYKNLWGLYARVNLYVNNAAEELRIQDLRTYTFGTDVNWRWLQAGGEYVIYDSDQSRYNSFRLFQTATFRPDQNSSLSVGFTESWTDYIDANRQEENYRFITRYRRTFTGRLAMEVEGGVDVRRGDRSDHLLGTFRPGIDYTIGKLSLKAGYDFEYSLYQQDEERMRHLFFVRGKRMF